MSNARQIKNLEKKIADAGLNLVCVHESSGHFQVTGGALLVNWYPFSAKKTAYVRATKKGVKNAGVDDVIRLANTAPECQGVKDQRKAGRGQRAKKRLLAKHPFCHWCHCELTRETATLEHIIPLGRGGLDHHSNMTLACKPCNEGRGHNMPELEKSNEA